MKRPPLQFRFLLNGLLFISILFFPWWVSVALMFPLLFFWDAYEVVVLGLLIDVLYSTPVPLYGNVPLLFTGVALFLFVAIGLIKRRLIFYTE